MNVSTGMSGRAVRMCLSTEWRFGLLSSEKMTFLAASELQGCVSETRSHGNTPIAHASWQRCGLTDQPHRTQQCIGRRTRGVWRHTGRCSCLLLCKSYLFTRHERKKYTLPDTKINKHGFMEGYHRPARPARPALAQAPWPPQAERPLPTRGLPLSQRRAAAHHSQTLVYQANLSP